MDSQNRKSFLKKLENIINKKVAKLIEESVFDFSENYAETQSTPFLLEQIYQDKFDEIFLSIEK